MYKLWASIVKDTRILCRDKLGIILMFVMPIILAIVITNIQNSSFLLASDNKVELLLSNRDTGEAATELMEAIDKIGMFKIEQVSKNESDKAVTDRMNARDAMVAIIIPEGFSSQISNKSKTVVSKALSNLGLEGRSRYCIKGSCKPCFFIL